MPPKAKIRYDFGTGFARRPARRSFNAGGAQPVPFAAGRQGYFLTDTAVEIIIYYFNNRGMEFLKKHKKIISPIFVIFFSLTLVLAGLDKFFNIYDNWVTYLNPKLLHFQSHPFCLWNLSVCLKFYWDYLYLHDGENRRVI